MKLVVTGAAGFIGSVLSARAAARGFEVVALDDLSRGLNPIATLPLHFEVWDCRRGLPEAADGADAVVHLAAGTGSLDRPLSELLELNLGMLQTVYRAAGGAPFFWPTTSLALGVPDSPYVVSKEEGLRWLRGQPQAYPLRFFNVIGAHDTFTEKRRHEVHLLPTLVEAYRQAKPFGINGQDYPTLDGTPSRDYVNVLDVTDYILAMVEGARPEPMDDGAVWVGTGKTTTTRQVVNMFRALYGPVTVEPRPRRPFDTGALQCPPRQVAQLADVLGRPLVDVWQGIDAESRVLLEG